MLYLAILATKETRSNVISFPNFADSFTCCLSKFWDLHAHWQHLYTTVMRGFWDRTSWCKIFAQDGPGIVLPFSMALAIMVYNAPYKYKASHSES